MEAPMAQRSGEWGWGILSQPIRGLGSVVSSPTSAENARPQNACWLNGNFKD